MDDLLTEFLTETSESLDQLDVELVRLEQDPNDPELISNIFRLVHTIKGTCGFLGLPRLETVAHAAENVLGKFRDRELEVTPDAVTLVLESLDTIKELLGVLEATEAEPPGDDSDLIRRLNHFAETGKAEDAPPAPQSDAAPESVDGAGGEADTVFPELEPDEFGFVPVPAHMTGKTMPAPKDSAKSEPDETPAAESEIARKAAEPETGTKDAEADPPAPDAATAPPAESDKGGQADTDTRPGTERSADAKARPPAQAPKVPARTAKGVQGAGQGDDGEGAVPSTAAKGDRDGASIANQSIRVSVDLLENLMTTVSELVLTRNQLLQMVRNMADSEFTSPLQRLSHITTELQENVMKTRMQPIGNAWAKLPRIVRDLAQDLGKKIDLKMIGAETELDRQVLEMIRDPLTHMVRNSADHGLEPPDVRLKAGKSETGTVTLNAFHEGGHIIIQIADDGYGVNVQRVAAKALQNGITTEAELERMSDEQIQQFIFKAGFSTAEKVTSVSGRGVGMDVVRTNMEKIGGTIELKSEEGRGSTFTIKIPLTLAIVAALIVEAGGERFCMPQISVLELVRASKTSEHRVETIKNTPVLRLRDRLLPLISLPHALDLADGDIDVNKEHFVIVVQVGAQTFGVIVDRVFDTEEIVVKPVAPILRDISLFSGNTILGDGSVVMILDPNGLAASTGTLPGESSDAEAEAADIEDGDGELTSMLLFRAGGREPKAVPLGVLSRLEEIEVEKIETSGGRPLIQYRGELMPLVTLDGSHDFAESGRRPVLVFADGRRKMGLMVDEILDIVEERLKIELADHDTPGYLGSAVLAGKATDILDISHFVTRAFGDWFIADAGGRDGGRDGGRGGARRPRVLVVDDSAFFRNLLAPLLGSDGFDVTAVASAAEALALRERGRMFDAIVTDIEMPEMDGFAFAEDVRGDQRWRETPLVALSSHAAPEDFDRGRAVGFDDYIAKFDRDSLVGALRQILENSGELV